MKKNLILSLLSVALLLAGIKNEVKAVTAYPDPVKITQPDGSELTVQLKGDESVKWAETYDGYTLLYNKKGVFEYAISDGEGGITPSGIAAVQERTPQVDNLLAQTPKRLRYSSSQVSMLKSIMNMKSAEASQAFPTTGNRKLVCILMGFTDKSFTKTNAQFNSLFNQVNYSVGSATGSVKDFHLESSYGQFNLDVTVAGPYKASKNMSYYGGNGINGRDQNPRALVREAVDAADPDVNYANFDNDNDGNVDGIYVIYAGYGEEAGGGANAIWAHAWGITTVTRDGKKISRYSCSSELRGSSGSNITAIGVICHEFGHILGAPDYYDTDYNTGGNFAGTGRWDMMAAGSWNDNGDTPAQHNAFTKVYVYGWANATTLSSKTDVTVKNSIDNKSFYQINSTTNNEYWIMENRQKKGFDASIPGHGLIIYHVHKDVANVGNKINATYPQKMYPVCASASSNPGSSPSSYGSINSGGCPFPGTSNKTSFTDATTPHMKSWAGNNTNAPITNITESGGVIKFKFKGGGSGGDTQPPSKPSNLASSNVTSSSVDLSWSASSDNVGVTGYDVYQGSSVVKSVTVTKASITGLSPNTTYSFSIKAKDAAGNESDASNILTVKTSPVQPQYCNSKGDNSSYEWIKEVVIGSFTNSSGAAGYTDFTSKTVNLPAGSSVDIALTPGFGSTAYNEYWKIWIDYNNDKDFDDAGELVFDAGTMSKTTVNGTIKVASGAKGTTRMRVSMKYDGAQTACETFKYGEVEDYTVKFGAVGPDKEAPSIPTGLAASNVTTTSIELSWNASTDNVKVTGYEVFMDGKSLGTTANTSANITKLSPNTTYAFAVNAYDAAGNKSKLSKSLNVKTLSDAITYCASKGNDASYEWIDYIELGGMKNTTASNNGYGDFTNKVATVTAGSNVTMYVSAGFSSSSYTEYWSVWIDWDKDGTFESSERMIHGSSSSSNTLSASFDVPATASGTTRMRVSMKYNAAATPCETFKYGEVEDYTVSVKASAPAFNEMSMVSANPLGNQSPVFDFSVNPNPVSGNVMTIKFADIRNTEYAIYNTLGAKVLDGYMNSQQHEIDVRNLAEGIYIIKVNDGQKELVKRFIKE
ncbi:MAG: M6 family metalloprotease domain-containing protein [Bacteroidales bacterium]|nr:M6 family metalloprotease domain-containing protein [Bacteroidales bacterium]